MSISILVATHNGVHTLPRMLDAMMRLRNPVRNWRLLVIDNASTDATADLLETYRERLPLTIFEHPRRGKNRALNRGLASEEVLESDIIVFTDDDVIPAPNWLRALEAASDGQGAPDILGGPIRPNWEKAPPTWLLEVIPPGPAFALTADEKAPGTIRAVDIWGANMAVRGSWFRRGYRFNEGVGPAGGLYMMGSETDFLARIEQAGARAWFVPDASVEHIVRQHQLTTDWIGKRAFRYGRSQFHRQQMSSGISSSPRWRGVPRWLIRQQMETRMAFEWARLRRQEREVFAHTWRLGFLRGVASEFRKAYECIDVASSRLQ